MMKDITPIDILSLNNILDLEYYANKKELTYQKLAIIWLMYLGMDIKEIIKIRICDILNWEIWYKERQFIPPDIKIIVTKILSNAIKEEGIPCKCWTGTYYTRKYINSEFFVRKTSPYRDIEEVSAEGLYIIPVVVNQLKKYFSNKPAK